MNETAETKICTHCAEAIKAAAKICPHCRYAQRRWSLHNPYVAMAIAIIALILVIIPLAVFLDRFTESKTQFATHRDDLAVVFSQFSHRIADSNLMNTVVGTLTNRGDRNWKDIGVEAQFFDRSGKQIDAITAKSDDYRGFVILPHGDVAFKIEGIAAWPETKYDSYKVFVRWAEDANAWP